MYYVCAGVRWAASEFLRRPFRRNRAGDSLRRTRCSFSRSFCRETAACRFAPGHPPSRGVVGQDQSAPCSTRVRLSEVSRRPAANKTASFNRLRLSEISSVFARTENYKHSKLFRRFHYLGGRQVQAPHRLRGGAGERCLPRIPWADTRRIRRLPSPQSRYSDCRSSM